MRTKRRSLGDALRAARQALGLQVTELAEMTGVSRRTVARWELGDTAPNDERRRQVVAVVASRSYDVGARLAAELGVAPPPSPEIDVAAVARRAIERASILAADALDVSPRRARAALVMGLRELGAAGIGLDAFVDAAAWSAPEGGGARSGRVGRDPAA